jgi:hypothetical protein
MSSVTNILFVLEINLMILHCKLTLHSLRCRSHSFVLSSIEGNVSEIKSCELNLLAFKNQ